MTEDGGFFSSAKVRTSIRARTRPRQRWLAGNKLRKLDFTLEIGITKEDSELKHPDGSTVRECVDRIEKKTGVNILQPLFDHKQEIMNYVRSGLNKEIALYHETVPTDIRDRNAVIRNVPSLRRNSDADYASRRVFRSAIRATDQSGRSYGELHYTSAGIQQGVSVRNMLSRYGQYWVDVIRDYILGMQVSDSTVKRREYKHKKNPIKYPYPLGYEQLAVETGLIWKCIKYKVYESSQVSSEEIRDRNRSWAEKGRYDNSGRESRSMSSSSSDGIDFPRIMDSINYDTLLKNRYVLRIKGAEVGYMSDLPAKYKRAVNEVYMYMEEKGWWKIRSTNGIGDYKRFTADAKNAAMSLGFGSMSNDIVRAILKFAIGSRSQDLPINVEITISRGSIPFGGYSYGRQ